VAKGGDQGGVAEADEPGSLASYQAKRDFGRTPEPAGGSRAPGPSAAAAARRFVVQRHRARRLHYDLRLEIDGVLVSWAVPAGPTLDPKAKRLAVRTEDHPMEYQDFEGVIPAREYGGGDVIVWDAGTWEPYKTGDPAAELAAGTLHAELRGRKLAGQFVLVRTSRDGDQDQWLLRHKDDEHAVQGWSAEDHPESVRTGRTNDQVRDGSWPEPDMVALDALGDSGIWHAYGRELRLTNLDKELFPGRAGEPPVTKRELISYAARIGPVVLPYLTGRPLHMHRFPGGAAEPGFWHKQLPGHAPDWVPRWRNPDAKPDRSDTYLVVDEPAALIWAANFGALEWHAWTAKAANPSEPSYALIDIDPGPATSWDEVLTLARLHRTALDHLGVRGYPKVTGRRGIQVWIPVSPGLSYADTRGWVEQLSKAIGAVTPHLVSWKWDVSGRGGLARLDYTQNTSHKTLVAPYSPRAEPGAPVSAPIAWDELDDPGLRPDGFTIRTMLDRIGERGDLFRGVLEGGQQLQPIR
jgi:bifunctional non-homologous end joining protein LigD